MAVSAIDILSFIRELLANREQLDKFKEIVKDVKELIDDIKDVIALIKS